MPGDAKAVETPNTNLGAEGTDAQFESSFNEAVEGKTPEEKPAETPPEKEEGADTTGEKPEAEKQAEEDAAKLAEKTGSQEEDEEDYKQKYKTLQGMFDKETKALQEKLKELEGKIVAPPAKEEPSKKDDSEELTKLLEGDDEIKSFLEEYDYLGGPLLKIVGKVLANSKKDGAGSSQEEINQAVTVAVHFATIQAIHPDYNEITKAEEGKPSELKKFVDTYSGSDKQQIEDAYNHGNAQQVIDLVNLYKKSKETPANDDLKQKRDKKLADLAAVPKKDGAINTNAKGKPSTFEEAFNQAAEAAK